ncbi:uncharacterized protein BYT42DRAFT_576775 [Radiomyces spectabilis]|uniref:uncharacterized protein n=1 Tax=Radiomyces spectabilis TaxID=64574 RepID=UPI00221FF462|nr:uncharacterized protein BYT42DRAFT_576775 [Radiomyces spectabilis]KAI8374567.1 hypothetical protein BYT42DRAFT_576775 [Radiomyces spectabilis]
MPSFSNQPQTDQKETQQVPVLPVRIYHLAWARIFESKATITYVGMTIFSTVYCIILEAMIAVAHTNASYDVRGSDIASGGGNSSVTSALGSDDQGDPYAFLLLNLQRLKDENVFFALFHVFQLYLGMDAIIRQNVIQLMAHTANEFLSIVLALVQLGETLKWRSRVATVDDRFQLSTSRFWFGMALKYEISLAVVMAALTGIFAYLCVKLLQEFGWNVYKRIGADITLQERFRTAQLFLLNLKLDAFFHTVFCIFWLVIMTQENYMKKSQAGLAWYVLHWLLTLGLVPAPFVARYGLMSEKPKVMMAYQTFQVLVAVDFIVILQQSASSWVFWVLAVCLAIFLSICTIILAILVTRNFDKGLKPHFQHLFDADYRLKLNPRQERDDSWVIDDEASGPHPSADTMDHRSPPPAYPWTDQGGKFVKRAR